MTTLEQTIKELRELDAKRTQGEWRYFGEGFRLAVKSASHYEVDNSDNEKFIIASANLMPKLLDCLEVMSKALNKLSGTVERNDSAVVSERAIEKVNSILKGEK